MSEKHNPWLAIPLADYERHMGREGVGQLDVLAALFEEAVRFCIPQSVAILGVAGGNGIERIDPATTTRVVGVDINAAYLEATGQRFVNMAGLELHCADFAADGLETAPVDLVHAALIFEHAGTGRCLENALRLVAKGGRLSVVLQLPGSEPDVGWSDYQSIARLRDHFTLIDPVRLSAEFSQRGLELEHATGRPLPGGKSFWMGIFRAPDSAG